MTAPTVLVATALAGASDGMRVALTADALHHLRRVLRLADGSALVVTDGAGGRADARLDGDGVVLTGPAATVVRPAPRLALAQAVTQGRRAEEAVRTACELGVDLVVPVVAARTQGRPDAAARAAIVGRWRGIAAAALEQSGGAWCAEVADARDTTALASAPAWEGQRLVAVPGAAPLPDVVSALPRATADVATIGVAVGPEGGWTADEVASLTAAGWVPVGLGPTVLRSEHAGPAALAVLAATVGRWAAAGAAAVG